MFISFQLITKRISFHEWYPFHIEFITLNISMFLIRIHSFLFRSVLYLIISSLSKSQEQSSKYFRFCQANRMIWDYRKRTIFWLWLWSDFSINRSSFADNFSNLSNAAKMGKFRFLKLFHRYIFPEIDGNII